MNINIRNLFLFLSLLFSSFSDHAFTAPDDSPSVQEKKITSEDPYLRKYPELEPQDESRFFYEFMNMLFYLGILIFLLFAFMWLIKRMTNSRIEQLNTTSDIKILERRSVSPKTSIYLIQIEDKRIAITESLNGVTLLSELPTNSQFDEILAKKFKK